MTHRYRKHVSDTCHVSIDISQIPCKVIDIACSGRSERLVMICPVAFQALCVSVSHKDRGLGIGPGMVGTAEHDVGLRRRSIAAAVFPGGEDRYAVIRLALRVPVLDQRRYVQIDITPVAG